jgi:ABC-type branched-subunit amino acid transport system ATPase component
MSTDILSVQDIRKSFGNLHALDNVSLDVPERKITILVGPNGSGKTTLINVISGQYKPDSGKVLFQGSDATGLPPYDLYKKGLSRTFQIPALFWKLTVLENLLVAEKKNVGESLFWSNMIAGFRSRKDLLRPLFDGSAGRLLIKAVSSIENLISTRNLLRRAFSEKELVTFLKALVTLSLKPWREFFTPIWRQDEKRSTEKASRILDLLGLRRVWNQPAYLLSGGQMKLVEIGRALMSDAKLILLDEPVSGVNPTLAHEIFARIIKLRDELGLTFFIVEHRLDIALRYVDQMFAMAMGKVIASGRPDEVMNNRAVIEAYLGG